MDSISTIYCLLLFSLLESTDAAVLKNRVPPSFKGLPTINELAASAGYTATNYEVITEDGYSLWLHRIGNNTGPPVLIMHGLFVAADSWITRGNRKDLAFMLLEEGFDVWLPNERGTSYNEYSLKYHRKDPRFWNFSFHESGYYDIPAFIDTVLEIRGMEKLFYVGHSLASTVFLVMASTRPEYNSKVSAAVFLSPVAFLPALDDMTPTFQLLLRNADLIYASLLLMGQYEIGYRTVLSIAAEKELCTLRVSKQICLNLFGLLGGEHRTNLDEKDWEAFIPHYGAGTSLKTLYHLAQLGRSGEFRQFDHGRELNMISYRSIIPPSYSLDLVTAPVALFWGKNDPLMSQTSVGRLASSLPNLISSTAVADPRFTHLDMYLGDNAGQILYPDIIGLFKSYTPMGKR